MYDIGTKSINRLSGSLSSKFVDVAEENIFEGEASVSDPIDRIDETVEDDSDPEPSNIFESVVSLDSTLPIALEGLENKIVINSGYSGVINIKNE
jgi:hypothetical protein